MTSNVRKRIGLFDAENGFFFEQDGTNIKVVRRTKTSGTVVDNVINQADWNLDKLDGTGASGITLDSSKDNLYILDYQWLGAGRIRFGFDFGGQISYFHEIKHANANTVPFTVTGDLPFRAEIFNTGTAAAETTFDFTCMAIASEGGFNPLGTPIAVQNTTRRTVTAANGPFPIISIRPRTTFNGITNRGIVIPKSYTLMSEDATVRYQIILNGSLTGAAWVDANTTHSILEYDISATAISGGLPIDSGFITGLKDKKESGNVNEELMSKLVLTNHLEGDHTDILTIVVWVLNETDPSSI